MFTVLSFQWKEPEYQPKNTLQVIEIKKYFTLLVVGCSPVFRTVYGLSLIAVSKPVHFMLQPELALLIHRNDTHYQIQVIKILSEVWALII